jgi:hypothetical protein
MVKLVRSALVALVFVLPVAVVLTGCERDDAGGNEKEAIQKSGAGVGTVGPDAPKTPEDYYAKRKK